MEPRIDQTDSQMESDMGLGLGEALVALIGDRTGLEIKPKERDTFIQQLVVRARTFSPPSLDAYYQHLCADPLTNHQEWAYIAQLLTNGESFFFRDSGQVLALKRDILPELIRRQSAEKKLRICSAGCATGEEVYSVVILLHELMAAMGEDIAQWDVKVYGLDLNPAFIAHAKAGVYRSWSLRGVNEQQQQTYFREINAQFHIDPKFKAQVTFYPFNLVSDSFVQTAKDIFSGAPIHDPLEGLDLIICRNVFIYFSVDAIAKVVDKFYRALSPLGYLLTGHAELYGQSLELFQVKTLPESLVFQRPADSQLVSLPYFNREQSVPLAEEALDALDAQILAAQTPDGRQSADAVGVEDSLLQKAQALFKNKDFKPALYQAEKALRLQPGDPYVLSLIAQIYAALNDLDQSLHYCQEAIAADSCFLAPHYLLSKIFIRKGDLAAAKRALKKIIYLEPNAVVAYLELSQLYRQEGNLKKSNLMRRCAFDIFGQHLPASGDSPDG